MIFRWLREYRRSKSSYQPLIEIFLSKQRLLHNLHTYQTLHPGVGVAPVLKSNAYGHGLIPVGQILQQANVPFLIVDSLYEAKILRHQGVRQPLFIIGYTSIQNIKQNKLGHVAFVITSLAELKRLSQEAKRRCVIHLKIDTGMHRQGLLVNEIEEALSIIKHHQQIYLEGICSHLADADGLDPSFTQQQIATWKKIVNRVKQIFPNLSYIHLANSAGTSVCDEGVGNVMRVGLGLYGLHPPNVSRLGLSPVLEMKTIISSVKTIEAQGGVGYNVTFTAPKRMVIATVPVGYFEGVDRRLSNRGFFMVRDIPCPIIGRVSMNITTIDVSTVPNIVVGDVVTVIGNDSTAPNSVEQIAQLSQTISHEIFVHIPPHLRRTIIEDTKHA